MKYSILAIGLLFIMSACHQQPETGVKHVVIFKFTEETTKAQIDEFTKEFISLKKRIPEIVSFDYGTNNSPENLNHGYTHIYLLTFADNAARDAYLIHPEHVKFTGYVGETGIVKEVFVLDYLPTEVK
ncbi:MAG: Dabb family protein [Cyclobacteriaceae bacterium]|jgi:hypothetical protein|nr:Dabb family protein [Cyclobacteriaceae bacterium]